MYVGGDVGAGVGLPGKYVLLLVLVLDDLAHMLEPVLVELLVLLVLLLVKQLEIL